MLAIVDPLMRWLIFDLPVKPYSQQTLLLPQSSQSESQCFTLEYEKTATWWLTKACNIQCRYRNKQVGRGSKDYAGIKGKLQIHRNLLYIFNIYTLHISLYMHV